MKIPRIIKLILAIVFVSVASMLILNYLDIPLNIYSLPIVSNFRPKSQFDLCIDKANITNNNNQKKACISTGQSDKSCNIPNEILDMLLEQNLTEMNKCYRKKFEGLYNYCFETYRNDTRKEYDCNILQDMPKEEKPITELKY
jgi:hypothetical protein